MILTVSHLLAVVVGYLIGSVSFGVILSRMLHRDDIRHHGSGNAGMTNALRVYGSKTAIWVLLGDFLKGTLSVWLGGVIGGRQGSLLAAVAVIIGHLFPIFFGFRGGKGVATAAGAVLAINPLALAILIVPFGVILLVTRYMSLAAIVVAVGFPVVTAVQQFVFPVPTAGATGVMPWVEFVTSAIIGFLIVFMHRSNIGRLIKGTESKVGQKAPKSETNP